MKRFFLVFVLALAAGAAYAAPARAQADPQPVVRGVLFWMDSCPHCHYVIDEVLPPLLEQYGAQLDIVLIEVDSQPAAERFQAAGAAFGKSPDELGVPFLIVGDHVLVGSQQIPDELPGLIESYLAAGGVDIPNVDGLTGLQRAAVEPPVAAPTAGVEMGEADTTAAPQVSGISGGIPAFLVLAGMVLALVFAGVMLLLVRGGSAGAPAAGWAGWAIPALAVAGLAVAGYLTYVETQAAAAVCGPVGDCNAVQSSAYARLFGVPVGVIGLAGYVAILSAWLWGRSGKATARALLAGMAAVGVLFSIYLTYVELFVIKAVCMWCLSSAVIMTLLLLAAAAWLAQAWTAAPHPVPGRPARA